MAIDAGGWVLGTLVRFSDLHFIVNLEGGLERVHAPVRHDSVIDTTPITDSLRGLRLDASEIDTSVRAQCPVSCCGSSERQLGAFLGNQPARDNLRHALLSFADFAVQLSWGEPISANILTKDPPPPGGVHFWAAQVIQHHATLRMTPDPSDIEFVGVKDYVSESFHDLLDGASESLSDSDSGKACHYLSYRCFVVNTSDGHMSNDGGGTTLTASAGHDTGGSAGILKVRSLEYKP